MKILTICPTINLEKFGTMYETFELTRSKDTRIIATSNLGVTKAINEVFERNPDYDFYHITNDDVEYKTPLWDIKLAQKGKITYGDDLLQRANLCTFPMIDGNIARAVGWLQLPVLERYAGDVTWKFIGETLGILEYHPEIEIKHLWEGCAAPDINYADMARFATWLPMSFIDINKIRSVLQ